MMSAISIGQGLIINGGFVIMKGGVYVVVDKNANDGITRPAASGGIINKDENENNYVSWVIKNGASNDYIVPWLSSGLIYIPFTYQVNSPGSNDGRLVFSTWQTQSDNSTAVGGGVSGKPTGVTNMNNSSGSDNSLSCADRFWWTKFVNYTTKPTAGLTFGYNDPSDITAPNTFTESDLQAQYWTSSQWINPPAGADAALGNYVNGIAAQAFDAPWVLVSKNSPLPIELLSFSAKLRDTVVDILWTTVSEINSDFFIVERTNDFISTSGIAIVDAAGISNSVLDYFATDENPLQGTNYYRLKEVDYDGSITYSDWVPIEYHPSENSSSTINLVSIYPNPANDQINIIFNTSEIGNTNISVFDVQGKLLKTISPAVTDIGNTIVKFEINDLPQGMYIIRITNGNTFSAGRFVKSE
ncbi:MAG: T9SS type A sorting domain-containing protein [Bacteroidota bacterium]